MGDVLKQLSDAMMRDIIAEEDRKVLEQLGLHMASTSGR